MSTRHFAKLVNPYSFFEDWWGEPLSPGLVLRIERAPKGHASQFLHEYNDAMDATPLTAVETGTFRPIVKQAYLDVFATAGRYPYVNRAMALLLYCEEVMLEDPLRISFGTNELARAARALLEVQELHALGIVRPFAYPPRYRHPSRAHQLTSYTRASELATASQVRDLEEDLEQLVHSHMEDPDALTQAYFSARSDVGASVQVASDFVGAAHLLATSSTEAVVMRIALQLNAGAADLRPLTVSRLAAIEVPEIDPSGVAAVRQSSSDFAEFRSAVSNALHLVQGIESEDEHWQQTARSLLADELGPMRERIQRETKRSPALGALVTGVRNLGYSGFGAATGALVGGNVAASALGAGGAQTASFVVDYLRAAGERRRGRAVLDLAVSFM